VLLATGGIGQLYELTTNPPEARGDGLAMAARAGAVIADAEFVQFHPTAFDIGKHPAPLATEAIRGEGAHLINAAGERFMLKVHPKAELAPRDIVARAVQMERASGQGAFLDCRAAIGSAMKEHFPTVYAACQEAGLDPAGEPIPVAPAAHYHMGGIATDEHGRSSLPGLWAVGEVASTGLHGANRLASNSLLEAVVMAARAVEDIAGKVPSSYPRQAPAPDDGGVPPLEIDAQQLVKLQKTMTANAGVTRSAQTLLAALQDIEELARQAAPRSSLANMTDVSRFIIISALHREESRGSHCRTDFPDLSPMVRRSFLTYVPALQLSAEALCG
jgi:L-aspartate oxidase